MHAQGHSALDDEDSTIKRCMKRVWARRRGAQEVHGLIGNLLAAADAARSAITGALQSMHMVAASL